MAHIIWGTLEKATWCKKAKIFLFFNQHYYGLVKCSHKCHCVLLRLFVHGLIDLLLKKGRESTNILLVLIARGAPLLYWKYFCQLKVVTKLFQFVVRPWECQVVAKGLAVTKLFSTIGLVKHCTHWVERCLQLHLLGGNRQTWNRKSWKRANAGL